MIAIIDYGMGNLRSVEKALQKAGADTCVTQDPREVEKADKIVLPGVGAMKPAMERLDRLGLVTAVKRAVGSQKPFLGICLGLQLLFEKSDEGGNVQGLGIFKGRVSRFKTLKVPHMGWNQIRSRQDSSSLMQGISEGSNVYFCHSYFVEPSDPDVTLTTTDYGVTFTSSVSRGRLFGVQFHPEKSQKVGLKIMQNFTRL